MKRWQRLLTTTAAATALAAGGLATASTAAAAHDPAPAPAATGAIAPLSWQVVDYFFYSGQDWPIALNGCMNKGETGVANGSWVRFLCYDNGAGVIELRVTF